MKGNISRDSHRPANHYSGVFQVQGGMVTDADLGEQARIARDRADNVGEAALYDGVPESGGAVEIDDSGVRLLPGVVFADGVRGVVRATGEPDGDLGLYDAQLDFPLAPHMEDGELQVYADIWERTVVNLEDPNLSDPGLHGAETAFRQQTVAQIKWAPVGEFFDKVTLAETAALPRKGAGRLTVTIVDPETIADPCDPCADVVEAEQQIANALFRIEVLEVEGAADAPDAIRLAWSSENASAVAALPVDPEHFHRAGAVYQYFSHATETHLGVHASGAEKGGTAFATDLVIGPVDDSAPEGGAWPWVRRWDGVAHVSFPGGPVDFIGAGAPIAVAGHVVTITANGFAAELDFTGAPIVAGDFWLIELRRFGEPMARAVQETPIGIDHHYCPLFRVEDGLILALTDRENRRLSFPAVSNFPASHVSFIDNCDKIDRFKGAENVQEALDALCNIPAAEISFDPSDCPRLFDSTDNVQDALINLCKVDFGYERVLRLLHDWGVNCGAVPSMVDRFTIRASAGSIIDRRGKIGEFGEIVVKVADIPRFELPLDALAAAFEKKEVCLALTIEEGGEVKPVIARKSVAFGPDDPDIFSVFKTCMDRARPFNPGDKFATFEDSKRKVLEKVVYSAGSKKLASGQKLEAAEHEIAKAYNDDLILRYKAHVGEDAESKLIDERIAEIEAKLKVEDATGELRKVRRMQLEAARYGAVYERNQERVLECLCNALFPRCPLPPQAPHLVPIACLEGGVTNGGQIFITKVCPWACRKQAMSWRMVQYYTARLRDRLALGAARLCCGDPETQTGGLPTHKAPNYGYLSLMTSKPAGDGGWTTPVFDAGPVADKLAEYFDRLEGRTPASDYVTKLQLDELSTDTAREVAEGNGLEVVTTIDIDDATAVEKLREVSAGVTPEDLLAEGGAVRPGDKIAIITDSGVAVDYVKVVNGPGKALFDRKIARPVKTEDGGLEVDPEAAEKARLAAEALEARVAAAREAAAKAETDLAGAADARSILVGEIDRAARDLATLEGRREELVRRVGEAATSLDSVRDERRALIEEVERVGGKLDELNAERASVVEATERARIEMKRVAEEQEALLASVRTERERSVLSIRREMPVTSVVRDNEKMAAALAEAGVVNMARLATMPDADLVIAARKAGLNVTSARRLKREAKRAIEAPID